MESEDGATISFDRGQLRYKTPNKPETTCRFSKATNLWRCGDGTVSQLVTAALPFSFHGVLFAEFDGRAFQKIDGPLK
jgi:hypothetical protein